MGSREQLAAVVSWGGRFFLAAALTGSTVAGGYQPFALGFAAAAGAGAGGAAALAGCLVGAAVFLAFADGLRFFAAAVLIFAAATALDGTALGKKPALAPTVAAASFLVIHLIYLVQGYRFWDELPACLLSAALTALSAHLYGRLLQRREERGPILYLAVTVLVSVAGLELPGGVSPGRALAMLALLWAAYRQSRENGAAAGLAVGLAMDLGAGGEGLFYTALYGLVGLGCTLRLRGGRLFTAAVAVAVTALCAAFFGQAASAVIECALAGIAFLLLPGRLFAGKRLQAQAESTMLEHLRHELGEAAAALRELHDSFARPTDTAEDPAVIFDRAAEGVCRSCPLCQLCWQRDYTATVDAMNGATAAMLERGRTVSRDFPPHFSSRCVHFPELLEAINRELSAFLLRRQYRLELQQTRRGVQRQYAQLSDLLSATAAHLGEQNGGGAACRVGAVVLPREGERVSGDSLRSFTTEDGRLCLLLSDGMGTGEAARRESALAVRLMERFLKAGVEPEAALATLNGALSLRGEGSFTTVDLMVLSGTEGTVYKYGAAPSYVKRGGRVARLTGGALPAGLETGELPPERARFPLEPGSFFLQISDGVADAGHDEWVLDLLAGYDGTDPQHLCAAVAAHLPRPLGDDCAIQALYVQEAGETLV